MSTTNHVQAGRPNSVKFAEQINAFRSQCRSFAACVRLEYLAIEGAISDGVPLESIAAALSESYGLQGSLPALKSALSRIRRARDGQDCQQWLDRNAPLASQPDGGADVLSARPPVMNPHLQSGISPQPYVFPQQAMQQQFPGAGPSSLGREPLHAPVQYPNWPAPFPGHGQAPQWQPPPAGYNPYGGFPPSGI